MKIYIPNRKTRIAKDGGSVEVSIDFTEVNRAISFMESESGAAMADAIAQVLRGQVTKTQGFINSSVPPRKRFMGKKVADSLMVEAGVTAVGEAQVRFGSDPMDGGGVTGSRGGQLALMLEFGVKSFPYGFDFKTIEPSPSFGVGGNNGSFINAKVHPMYKGYDGIGYLAAAFAETVPKMEDAIMNKLQERFA